MIFHLSDTGNNRCCAKRLAHRLGDKAVGAPPLLRDDHSPAPTSRLPWVFVSPTYDWQLPRIFEALLRGGWFSGSRDVYFAMAYGTETDDPIPWLEVLCRDMDLTYRGVLPVIMPENYIVLFHAPGLEEARVIMAAVMPGPEEGAECIRRGESLPPARRGAIDKFESGPVNAFFYRSIIKAGPLRSTSTCVGCGKYTAICMENNIRLRDDRPVWGDRCTHCMACIYRRPAGTIEYGRASRGKPRYQCPEYWRERRAIEFEFCELEILLPEGHLEVTQQALWSVGADHIGRYDCCLSYSPTIGAWRPLASTAPYLGRMGEVYHAPELKMEVICRIDHVEETVAVVKQAHPYEEPVISVIPLYRTGL